MADYQKALRYKASVRKVQERYENDRDWNAYMANGVYIALQMAVDEMVERNPRLKGAKTALTASQHAIKGAIQTVAHRFSDPYHADSYEDVFSEIVRHARDELNHDLQPLRNFLANHLGISVPRI